MAGRRDGHGYGFQVVAVIAARYGWRCRGGWTVTWAALPASGERLTRGTAARPRGRVLAW